MFSTMTDCDIVLDVIRWPEVSGGDLVFAEKVSASSRSLKSCTSVPRPPSVWAAWHFLQGLLKKIHLKNEQGINHAQPTKHTSLLSQIQIKYFQIKAIQLSLRNTLMVVVS